MITTPRAAVVCIYGGTYSSSRISLASAACCGHPSLRETNAAVSCSSVRGVVYCFGHKYVLYTRDASQTYTIHHMQQKSSSCIVATRRSHSFRAPRLLKKKIFTPATNRLAEQTDHKVLERVRGVGTLQAFNAGGTGGVAGATSRVLRNRDQRQGAAPAVQLCFRVCPSKRTLMRLAMLEICLLAWIVLLLLESK